MKTTSGREVKVTVEDEPPVRTLTFTAAIDSAHVMTGLG